MKKLSKMRDTEIRNKLDAVAHLLYHDIAPFEDLCWAHATIKELLFIIDGLQEGMEESGDKAG